MKIVIDISEHDKLIVDEMANGEVLPDMTESNVVKAIQNGTPLPKGHGKLIDLDVYVRNVIKMPRINTKTIGLALQETPTIIEADKGEEECKKNIHIDWLS